MAPPVLRADSRVRPSDSPGTLAYVPFLLPHKVLHAIVKGCDHRNLFGVASMDAGTAAKFQEACRSLGIDESEAVGVSMWIDGVTCKWDRSESMDMLTLSFPGLIGIEKWKNLRIPLCVIDHCWIAKHSSCDDVFSVVVWSLRHALAKVHPAQRHDGQPWKDTDTRRKRRAGEPLGCRAVLCQFCADWKAYKDVLRFPQHNEVRGCCWLCQATPRSLRDTSADAPWRSARLGHWGCMTRMRQHGLSISPLFNAPGFDLTMCVVDWLHAADLGVGADVLGQLFMHVLPLFPGGNIQERLDGLWTRSQELYRELGSQTRLDNLTYKMLSPDAPAPKLKAYGSEVRCLIPVAMRIAEEVLSDAVPVQQALKQCVRELFGCCACLSSAAPFARGPFA